MLLPSIRRLALSDVNEDVLRELVEHGEDVLVERKRQLPDPPKFGAAAASLANTLGGWILLGVDDDRNVVGYEPPRGTDAQSHLASVLRNEVDPLPPFVAEPRQLDGKSIVAIRVFESADAPHIVRGTGAVYVRTSKGKEPIDDHQTLLALAHRGEEAEVRARQRLDSLPLVAHATPLGISAGGSYARAVVRAAPFTVTPQFTEWPISKQGASLCLQLVDELVLGDEPPLLESAARGAIARKMQLKPSPTAADWAGIVAADSGGVIATRFVQQLEPMSQLSLDQLRAAILRPQLNTIAAMLEQSEAIGRAALDVRVYFSRDLVVAGANRSPDGKSLHVAGELTIPASEDEVAALGRRWERELARNFGINMWETGD